MKETLKKSWREEQIGKWTTFLEKQTQQLKLQVLPE